MAMLIRSDRRKEELLTNESVCRGAIWSMLQELALVVADETQCCYIWNVPPLAVFLEPTTGHSNKHRNRTTMMFY